MEIVGWIIVVVLGLAVLDYLMRSAIDALAPLWEMIGYLLVAVLFGLFLGGGIACVLSLFLSRGVAIKVGGVIMVALVIVEVVACCVTSCGCCAHYDQGDGYNCASCAALTGPRCYGGCCFYKSSK